MRWWLGIAAVGQLLCLPLLATAQTEAKGEWKSENDSGNSVKLNPPTMKVAEKKLDFPAGDAEAILGKGGPSGVFLWAHLHAIHPDRNGSSDYKMTVLVRDEGNYHYMATPLLESTVVGVLDKPDRHRHSYGQFTLPPGADADALKAAVNGNVKLIVEISASRNNKGFFGDEPEKLRGVIGEYLEKKLSPVELLKKLNQGLTPKKP